MPTRLLRWIFRYKLNKPGCSCESAVESTLADNRNGLVSVDRELHSVLTASSVSPLMIDEAGDENS
jgi:hypothetical protein